MNYNACDSRYGAFAAPIRIRWLSKGEVQSPSTALSPPSKRRCGLTCLVFNILRSGI